MTDDFKTVRGSGTVFADFGDKGRSERHPLRTFLWDCIYKRNSLKRTFAFPPDNARAGTATPAFSAHLMQPGSAR
jgi:hypothetical protein